LSVQVHHVLELVEDVFVGLLEPALASTEVRCVLLTALSLLHEVYVCLSLVDGLGSVTCALHQLGES
jgi:hypothetical protein